MTFMQTEDLMNLGLTAFKLTMFQTILRLEIQKIYLELCSGQLLLPLTCSLVA